MQFVKNKIKFWQKSNMRKSYHDTINKVFGGILPTQFSSCLHCHSLKILEFIERK